MKNSKCHFCCSEDFEERRGEYIYRRNGKYLIVRDVPYEVCLHCGERYYPASTLLAIERRFKTIQEQKSEPRETLLVPIEPFAPLAA